MNAAKALGLSLLAAACSSGGPVAPPVESAKAAPAESASSAPAPPGPPASAGPAAAAPALLEPVTFATPREAFEVALAKKPLVIGIGEAHAQKSAGNVETVAKRFTADVLPLFQGRATDLLVELMMPPKGCQKTTAEVKTAHKPVTEKQSEQNQNDYVVMGEAARKMKIVPDLLRPSCEDLAAVSKAGADAVPKTLETIARLTVSQLKRTIDAKDSVEAVVIVYGGALHNDRSPPPERAAWSYGDAAAKLVRDRYVEIDLFAADLVGDDDVWKKQVWRARYDKEKLGDKTTLFKTAEGAYVVILPKRRAP